MVVLAVVGIIMAIGVASLGQIGAGALRADTNRFTSTLKYAYASAAINNSHYRLVINLDDGDYHTEVAQSALVDQSAPTSDADEFMTEEARRLADEQEEKNDFFDDDEENPFGVNRKVTFSRVQDAVVETQKLKQGHRFAKVVTLTNEIETGIAIVNFYPNGFQDQVLIVIKDEAGAAYTMITEPLAGTVKVYSDEIDVPDDFGEVEDDD